MFLISIGPADPVLFPSKVNLNEPQPQYEIHEL